MRVIKIVKEVANQCGVRFPLPVAKDENEEQKKVLEKAPIQLMQKTGYDSFVAQEKAAAAKKEGDESKPKGMKAHYTRLELVPGKVYAVLAANENGEEYEAMVHETEIPKELVDEFVEPAKVEPTKVEPTKVEPTKVEATKVEATKVEPTKVEAVIEQK